jgi:hypothetical protein
MVSSGPTAAGVTILQGQNRDSVDIIEQSDWTEWARSSGVQTMTADVDSADVPGDATVLSLVRPVPRDFAYRICAACHFPIAPHELVDDEYMPRHETCDPDGPTTSFWQVA